VPSRIQIRRGSGDPRGEPARAAPRGPGAVPQPRPGKREALARGLDRLGLLPWIERRQARRRTELVVVNYHRLGARPCAGGFDDGVLDATPEQFEAQLQVLRRCASVVGIDELRGLGPATRLPPAPVLVTFDDGYRTCVDVALPLLKRLGLRATFFIPTEHVEERLVFWWDRISYAVKRSPRSALALEYPRPLRLDLADRAVAARELCVLAERKRGLDLERFLAELAERAGVPWDRDLERSLADELIVTWDDVRRLRDAGMDVQSHTRRHRTLQTLTPEQQADELAGSRSHLERELGRPVTALAYPSGYPVVGDARLRRAVADAGYELGFSYVGGRNRPARLDPLDVRRQPVDPDQSLALFRLQLALPALAFADRRARSFE